MARAYVLLSGGIDSTTCLYLAHHEFHGNVNALSVDYGQRHKKEIEYAKKSCEHLRVEHKTLDLRSIVPKTMLTDKDSTVPDIAYADIQGVSPTYVPFRNGLLLAALTSYVHGEYEAARAKAKRWDANLGWMDPMLGDEWGIYFGAHAEDAHNWAYPDCSNEFTGSMAAAIYIGTYRAVRLHVPLQWMSKWQIIQRGNELGVKWKNTFSCYKGGDKHCGVCPTCRSRRDGFQLAAVPDPTEYEAIPERLVPSYPKS